MRNTLFALVLVLVLAPVAFAQEKKTEPPAAKPETKLVPLDLQATIVDANKAVTDAGREYDTAQARLSASQSALVATINRVCAKLGLDPDLWQLALDKDAQGSTVLVFVKRPPAPQPTATRAAPPEKPPASGQPAP